jgi:hypothetical protein
MGAFKNYWVDNIENIENEKYEIYLTEELGRLEQENKELKISIESLLSLVLVSDGSTDEGKE